MLQRQRAVSGFKPKPFPKWRLFERNLLFFSFKCSVNFVMVFLDSFSMSSPKPRQGPSPPSVEQILEDLSAAKDDDVVFKSPMLGEHVSFHAARDHTKGKTKIATSLSDKAGNLESFFIFCNLEIVLGSSFRMMVSPNRKSSAYHKLNLLKFYKPSRCSMTVFCCKQITP